jgi:hypothetical protein
MRFSSNRARSVESSAARCAKIEGSAWRRPARIEIVAALASDPRLLARRLNPLWLHSQWVARYTRFALRSPQLAERERSKFLYYHKQDLESILRQIMERRPISSYKTLARKIPGSRQSLGSYIRAIAEDNVIRIFRLKAACQHRVYSDRLTGSHERPLSK